MNNPFMKALGVFTSWFSILASRLSTAGAIAAVVFMVGMTLHIMVEITLRYFFSTSTYVLDEFVGYGVAAMTFLALGHTFENNVLIRVNFILLKIHHDIVRKLVEITCVVTTLLMCSFLARYFWKSVSRNFERGSTSETIAQVPLWIPESLALIGLIIFVIQMLAYVLRLLSGSKLMSE